MSAPRIPFADWTEPADVCGYGPYDEVDYDTVEEAVSRRLGDLAVAGDDDERMLDRAPTWPIEVTAYRRLAITEGEIETRATIVLEDLIENLGEEWGDPDGDDPDVTPAWREAALTFVTAVLATYPVWACEPVAVVLVSREEAAAMLAEEAR